MGGKTQQRVAGNAKPANSGRIRELLVNQSCGSPNKVITFSALSNKKSPSRLNHQKPAEESKNRYPSKGEVMPSAEPTVEIAASSSDTSSSVGRDNYRLIVRRVDGRDLYSRVKIDNDQLGLLQNNNSGKSVVPNHVAGVKKPPDSEMVVSNQEKQSDETTVSDEEIDEDETDEASETESCAEISGEFDELIDLLESLKEKFSATTETICHNDQRQIQIELEILRLLKTLVRRYSRDMSIEDWDYLGKNLEKWVGWIFKATYPLKDPIQVDFSAKVFKFIDYLIHFADNLNNLDEEETQEFIMAQSLLDDWGNFHSTNMFLQLLELFFKLVSTEDEGKASSDLIRPMIDSLANIIIRVDSRLIISHHSLLKHIKPNLEFDPDFNLPAGSIFCKLDEKKFKGFLAVCGLMRSNNRVVLVVAHSILSRNYDSICEIDSNTLLPVQNSQEKVEDEDIPIFPPSSLMSVLTSRDAIVSTLLKDYRVGDISVTINQNTDAYPCTLSYLFVWNLVIRYIVKVEKEIGQKIIHSLKKVGLIQRLLDNIFMLLPPLGQQDSLRFRIYKSASSWSKQSTIANSREQQSWNLEKFLKSPLDTTIKRPLNEIELIALHLYFSVALHMPITVRKWYNNNSNKRLCNLVNEYTLKHISHVICSLEMDSVHEKCLERSRQNENTNLMIRARPSAKEVYAIYSRDEFKMELTIKLPPNYPLGAVQIDGGKRVGVTDVKWRSWLLQLTTFLAHQNGPILDGIELWRKNIDKRFEGVEKCTICFSILHSNYQLPKKKCQTCSNIFHNLCLFKWFESSGNSTCPLCRNPW